MKLNIEKVYSKIMSNLFCRKGGIELNYCTRLWNKLNQVFGVHLLHLFCIVASFLYCSKERKGDKAIRELSGLVKLIYVIKLQG